MEMLTECDSFLDFEDAEHGSAKVGRLTLPVIARSRK